MYQRMPPPTRPAARRSARRRVGVAFAGEAISVMSVLRSRALVGDLTSTELVEREEAYLGPRVRALMVRLEGRDVSAWAADRDITVV